MPARGQRGGDLRACAGSDRGWRWREITTSASPRWRSSSLSGRATPPWRVASSCAWASVRLATSRRLARACDEMARGQFDGFAGADQQHGGVFEPREGFLRQPHRGGGHRHRIGADAGIGARALGGGEGVLEQAVELAAQAAGVARASPRRPSPGPGSAARPAPANPARWRRGTGGARRRRRDGGTGRRAGRRRRPDAWPASRPAPGRRRRRRRTARCGCRSTAAPLRCTCGKRAQRSERGRHGVGRKRDALAQADRRGLVVDAEDEQTHSRRYADSSVQVLAISCWLPKAAILPAPTPSQLASHARIDSPVDLAHAASICRSPWPCWRRCRPRRRRTGRPAAGRRPDRRVARAAAGRRVRPAGRASSTRPRRPTCEAAGRRRRRPGRARHPHRAAGQGRQARRRGAGAVAQAGRRQRLSLRGREATLALRRGDERAGTQAPGRAAAAAAATSGWRQALGVLGGGARDPQQSARLLEQSGRRRTAFRNKLQAWLAFGGLAQGLEQPELAERIVAEVVERFPGEPRVGLLRASQLREAGKADEARKVLAVAGRHRPATTPELRLADRRRIRRLGDYQRRRGRARARPAGRPDLCAARLAAGPRRGQAALTALYEELRARRQPSPIRSGACCWARSPNSSSASTKRWTGTAACPAARSAGRRACARANVLHELKRDDEAYQAAARSAGRRRRRRRSASRRLPARGRAAREGQERRRRARRLRARPGRVPGRSGHPLCARAELGASRRHPARRSRPAQDPGRRSRQRRRAQRAGLHAGRPHHPLPGSAGADRSRAHRRARQRRDHRQLRLGALSPRPQRGGAGRTAPRLRPCRRTPRSPRTWAKCCGCWAARTRRASTSRRRASSIRTTARCKRALEKTGA